MSPCFNLSAERADKAGQTHCYVSPVSHKGVNQIPGGNYTHTQMHSHARTCTLTHIPLTHIRAHTHTNLVPLENTSDYEEVDTEFIVICHILHIEFCNI